MPRIPRTERSQGLSVTQQPFMYGDSPVGGAVAKLGSAIASMGDAFEARNKADEQKRDELDMFQTKIALSDFTSSQDIKQKEWDNSITGDGREHTSGRLSAYDTDADDLYKSLPNNEKARQAAALTLHSMRGRYGEQSYNVQQKNLGTYYESEASRFVSQNVLPRIDGSRESVESGLTAIDQVISATPGISPKSADKIRSEAAKSLINTWIEKSGADAAIDAEDLIERYKESTQPLEGEILPPEKGAAASVTRQGVINQAAPKIPQSGQPGTPSGPSPVKPIAAPAVAPKSAAQIDDLGSVSAKYESAGRGVGFISSGKGDPGGRSYGVHQLSGAYSMGAFLRSEEGAPFRERFGSSRPQSAAFNRVYREIAAEDPEGFAGAQKAFYTRTHYEPVRDHAMKLGFDVTNRGVQEALFSMSVQHGKAKAIVDRAAKAGAINGDAGEQIKALYKYRTDYVSGLGSLPSGTKTAVLNRYTREVRDALRYSGRVDETVADVEGHDRRFGGQVADASGRVTPAQPRTAREYFYETLQKELPNLKKRALQIEREQERKENEAIKDLQHKTERDGLEHMYKRTLTRDWVNENKDQLSNSSYDKFMRAVTPKVTATDPETYADLRERADENPEQVIVEAGDAYANGMLNQDAYDRVYSLAKKSMTEATRRPGWVTEQRQLVKKALRPTASSTPDEMKAYTTALEQYDAYIDDMMDTKDGEGKAGAKGLDRKAVSEFAQKLITDQKETHVLEKRKGLSMPRFSQAGRDSMNEQELQAAIQRTSEAYKAGRLTKEELATEIQALKKWDDFLRSESGKSAPAVPPKRQNESGKP